MFRTTIFRRLALALVGVIVSLSLLQVLPRPWFAPAQAMRADAPVQQLLLSLCVTSGNSRLLAALARDEAAGPLPATPVPGEPVRTLHGGHCVLCSTDPDGPAPMGVSAIARLPRVDPGRGLPADALPVPLRHAMGRVRARAPPIA